MTAKQLLKRANGLFAARRYVEAIAAYDQVLALDPNLADAWNNGGSVLAATARETEALADFEAATRLEPAFAEAHYNMSLVLLRSGDHSGWDKHEYRLRSADYRARNLFVPEFFERLWIGQDLAGKSILLQSEQGLGDTIQFCRYAKLVAERGARVVMDVPMLLMSLLRTVEGVADVILKGTPPGEFDYHCPLMSLPHRFDGVIPAASAYITADPDAVIRCHRLMPQADGLRIGLAWSGGGTNPNDHHRSISLSDFVAAMPAGAQMFVMQKDIRSDDLAFLQKHMPQTHVPALAADFSTTAGAMMLLDAVVTVDTSIAHLAGALGVPTFLLLSYCGDWRWFKSRSDTPWYPSMRIFRQTTLGDWNPVFAQVRAALEALD